MNFDFCPVHIEDADILFQWRNDSQTRHASINPELVVWGEHLKWLEQSLKNPMRSLFLVKLGGLKVGTVRVDRLLLNGKEIVELSWTIAPECRGQGYGSSMLRQFAFANSGPFVARIKNDNKVSLRMAEKAGFVLSETFDGVATWTHPGKEK